MEAASRSALLIEREGEEEALAAALARAASSAGGVVVIEGPAGIGKSSLLAEAGRLADAGGAAVAIARGTALAREFPFGVVVDLAERLLETCSPAEREDLLGGPAGRIEALLASEASGEIPATLGATTFGLVHGFYRLLAGYGERRVLLLGIDDCQWADKPSLLALHYVAERIEGLAVTLVLAERTGEPDPRPEALAAIHVGDATLMLRPRPLSAAGSATLVRSVLAEADDAFCASCERASAGNPFYLRGLLDAARADGLEPDAASADRVLELEPAGVSRSVLARIGRMAPASRSLAFAAAVGGEGVSLATAAALAGLGDQEASAAADTLSAAEILAPDEPLRFTHPLVREVVYGDLPRFERGAKHLEAARLLAASDERPELVAAHLLEAPAAGERWAGEALHAAAIAARAHGDPAAAVRYARRALEEPAERELRGELLALVGLAEADAGEDIGTAELGDAVGLLSDRTRRAEVLVAQAMRLSYGGRHPHAATAARQGLEELGDADPALAARLEAVHAMSAIFVDLTDAEATAARVEASIAGLDAGVEAASRAVIANASVALAFAGRSAAELRPLAESALEGGSPEDDPFDVVAFQLGAFGLLLAGDVRASERAADAAVAAASERGSMLELAGSANVRAMARFHAGRLVESLADAEIAIEAGRWGWGTTLPMTHAYCALARLERGEAGRAEEALELPGGEARWMVNVSYGMYLVARAAVWAAKGRQDAALEQLRLCGALAGAVNASHPALAPWRGPAASLLLARGEKEEAARLADEDLEHARAFGAPGPIGAALRVRGLVLGGSQGLELLRESERCLAGTSARLEHARTLLELGGALRRANQRKQARDLLRQALEFARLGGAVVLAERARDELRASGARLRRRALTGVEALTPSERRVAELAASGLTNRQIAQQLFVTLKTVETHLSRAFRKLDISSRSEISGVIHG